MRKLANIAIGALILAGTFFFLKTAFPKYTVFLPFFLALVLLDVYLWNSIKNKILSKKASAKYVLSGIYWLPLMLLISSIVTGFAISFRDWNIAYRTYLMGIITVAYVSKFIITVFLFLSDVIRAFQFFFHGFIKKTGEKFTEITRPAVVVVSGWILGTVFFLLFVCGMVFWDYDFTVKEQVITLPELPASFEGTRIVQVSDIHLGSWTCTKKLREVVDIINSQHPDIVFFTGDLVNYSNYEAAPFVNILKEIKAPLGIFCIMGNHDYGDYISWSSPGEKRKSIEYLHDYYKNLGWKLLLNEHLFIHRNHDSIALIGVENWGGTKRFPKLGNLEKATKGLGNPAVQLLLSHDPSHWDKIVRKDYNNIDVTFSGHTHGFQLGIECCGIRWSPAQYIYKEWAGLYSDPVPGSHPQYLYVNRGLGSIGYPGRIGILPEITLFILKKGNLPGAR